MVISPTHADLRRRRHRRRRKESAASKVMPGSLIREQISAAILDLEPVNETAGFTKTESGGNYLRTSRLV